MATKNAIETALKTLLGNDATDFHTVDVVRNTGQISIPPTMTYNEAILWLQRKRDADEQQINVTEKIEGFPLDVAHAVALAIQSRYGFSEAVTGWNPPQYISIPTDATGGTVQVLVGPFTLPGVDGTFTISPVDSSAVMLSGKVKRKHSNEVKELATLVRSTVAAQSLYKGKAVRLTSAFDEALGMSVPTFMNMEMGTQHLMLNSSVQAQLEATVHNPIRYRERALAAGIPLKRGALLEGVYGTGKTLAANLTAQVAIENGWTYVYVPNVSDLIWAYEIAKQWQPVVVLVEDLDGLDTEVVQTLSTTLDGVNSKNAQIILVATTNHKDKIPPILLRSGRLDSIVHFDLPDADTIRRLVIAYGIDVSTGTSLLTHNNDSDWTRITESMIGFIPANIREVVERSKLYAIARDPLILTPSDLVASAVEMREHSDLSKPKDNEPTNAERLETALRNVFNLEPVDLSGIEENLGLVRNRVTRIRDVVDNIPTVDHSNEIEDIQERVIKIQKSL
jgi:transitional endoplasmic reticulum ATPase